MDAKQNRLLQLLLESVLWVDCLSLVVYSFVTNEPNPARALLIFLGAVGVVALVVTKHQEKALRRECEQIKLIAQSRLARVNVKQNGGDNNWKSANEPASYKYDVVLADTGEQILTAATPRHRWQPFRVSGPASTGYASYDLKSNTWELEEVREIAAVNICS